MVRIVSWNINSISTSLNPKKSIRGLSELIKEINPDIICFGETKIQENKVEEIANNPVLSGFDYQYWNCSTTRKGYSGTAILTKVEPISYRYLFKELTAEQSKEIFIDYDIESAKNILNDFINEGRLIILEYPEYFLIHSYTPNSGSSLDRLNERVCVWDRMIRWEIRELEKVKPVIYTGDLNVAHNEIDIHSPKTNLRSAGFTYEERTAFTNLLKETTLVDTYRLLNPDKREYTFFWAMGGCREKNKGWRIDYSLVSKTLLTKVKQSSILKEYYGSDHLAILLDLSN